MASLLPYATSRNPSKNHRFFTFMPLRRPPPPRRPGGGRHQPGRLRRLLVRGDGSLAKNGYVVRYRTLVKDDFWGPLREVVSAPEVRPRPPVVMAADYRGNDVVGAVDDDGWWVGKITGRVDDKYSVYFETTGDLIGYEKDRLRIHQDWIKGKWIYGSHGKSGF